MAMLAEPRRKQKWSVDPRNTTWSNDESKFGQKMLEKMGWSKGKGLGAQEQGSTEHVKVQLKNNTLGLGASNKHEDNWIAHQDDFNQLLADLSGHHGAGSAASSDNETKKSFSLEEKSKLSKKRVHYMKFAKGKDLSNRSDSDLACVFGRRDKVKKSSQDESNSDPEQEESKSPSPTPEIEQGNMVTSSVSVNEYFAKRMAELKKSYGKGAGTVAENEEQYEEDSAENQSETKRKSKKKKHRKNENDDRPEEEEVENLQDDNNVDSTDCRERRRKNRKSKKEDKELSVDNSEDHEEAEDQEEKQKKKKNKKNKRKKELDDEREMEDVASTPDEDIDTKKPKKKKNKRKED